MSCTSHAPYALQQCLVFNLDEIANKLKTFSELALKQFNEKEGRNLEFVKIVKANRTICAGSRYYITFDVKDANAVDDGTMEFQACVWGGIGHTDGITFQLDEEMAADDDEREALQEIINNTKLSEGFGSGWFETLLNSHMNVSSNGEIFYVQERRDNISSIMQTLDRVYNLDWLSSASKNHCSAAVGFKWMLNQGLMEHHNEILEYFNSRGVSLIFLFRRNLLRRLLSVLANSYDKHAKQLNGTHKAHVHSPEEAETLSKYKPTINSASVMNDLKQMDVTMPRHWNTFTKTRHIILYYEDLIKNHTAKSSAMDDDGHQLPTLVYLAREKRPQCPHNFKAGSMNALIRVSSEISNAPIILNLDCDMYSNDSDAIKEALCFFMDEKHGHKTSYVQHPQSYNNITKNDIYSNVASTTHLCPHKEAAA
ncbi:Cellulose synthase-like protein E6 [Camellia lanceoleosa]|nr:Cellulose synthase-like protein E6 [Camellia lanceoleosa]